MATQAAELRYAVRIRVVLKYLGQLSIILAGFTIVPLVMSFVFGDTNISVRYSIVIAGLVAAGGGLSRIPASAKVQANEGMVLVALMFLLTALVMSYPLMASGMGFADALFEAVSAVTTTGLSARANVADAPDTFFFARAWMQWYGGLGIVVFSLALLVHPGPEAHSLAAGEAEADDLVGGTRAYARMVIAVYGVMTAVGVAGCWIAGLGLVDAFEYTFSGVSTGGFAPTEAGLAQQGWPIQVWVTLLCFAGSVPLGYYYRIHMKKQRVALDLLQLKALVVFCTVATLALGATMWLNSDVTESQVLHHSPLLAISAQSTAGFSTVSCAELDASSKLVLMFSMLAGGGVGSTAGGVKLLRLLVALSVLRVVLVRTSLPKHAVSAPGLAGRRLDDKAIHAALLLIVLFLVVVALSWLPFVAWGYSPIDSLFEVVSATGTVGLSAGVTSSELPPLLKAILCIDMFMGRLEIMAWLVVFYSGTWFGQRMEEA